MDAIRCVSNQEVAVRSLLVEFFAPIRYESAGIVIDLCATSVGTTSFVLEYAVRTDDRLFATARSVMVLIDPETQSKRPLSLSDLAWVRGFLDSAQSSNMGVLQKRSSGAETAS